MKRNRSTLKGYFQKGEIPTESNFVDLIDSMLNQEEDHIFKPPNDPLSIKAIGEDESLINFYRVEQGDNKLTWQVKQNPGNKPGLSIHDASDGNSPSKIFIESGSGNIGIGTSVPAKQLHIQEGNISAPLLNEARRPGIALTGQYPELNLFSKVANTNHGPTIRLGSYDGDTGNAIKQWVIGTSGRNSRFLDFGFSTTNNGNPHNGIRKHSGTTVLTLLENGNVGIGTIDPKAKLTIQQGGTDAGDNAKGKMLFVSGPLKPGTKYDGGIEFRHDNLSQGIGIGYQSIYATGYNKDQPLNIYSRGNSPLTLNSYAGGNVGIGEKDPQRKLHIGDGGQISLAQSNSVVTDSQAGIYWHGTNDYAIYRTPGPWTGNTYQQLKIDWPTGIILEPGTGNNQGYDKSYVEITGGKGLRVTQGNVGIGKNDPKAKLEVDGPMIRRVAVATGLGPNDETDKGQIKSRVLNFTKLRNDSAVRILYCDNLRIRGYNCSARWEIRIDGKAPPNGAICQDKYHTGPLAQIENVHAPATIIGHATGIRAGQHQIQVWVVNPVPGHPRGADAYTGWHNSRWTIEAQEVWL